ncbi:MAG TPA: M48 family metallopeptidase [Terriglobales bacterium]
MYLLGTSVAPLATSLSPYELARARQYFYGDLVGGVCSEIWLLASLALLFYSHASQRWQSWLERQRFPAGWRLNAAVFAAVLAAVLVAQFPFSLWIGFFREREFGFQHLPLAGWLAQWGESLLVTVAVGTAAGTLGYAALGRRNAAPKRWWLRLWAVAAVIAVIGVAIDPVVIEPLFNHFTPMANSVEAQRIGALAARAGIPEARILEMDASQQSAHTNAFVTGILGSQRIIVYDTLLREQSPAEIDFVVAHEIGHYVLHHLWKGVAFTLAYMLGLFALLGWLYGRWSGGVGVNSPAGFPLLLLILVGAFYLSAPLPNGFSRWEEHQADVYGLHLTGDRAAATASFVREEHSDLIYPDPPEWIVWWFFNHPSQAQRLKYVANARL